MNDKKKIDRFVFIVIRVIVLIFVSQFVLMNELIIYSFLTGLILIPLFTKKHLGYFNLKKFYINFWLGNERELYFFFVSQFLFVIVFFIIMVFLSFFEINVTDLFYLGIFDNSYHSSEEYKPGLPLRYQ